MVHLSSVGQKNPKAWFREGIFWISWLLEMSHLFPMNWKSRLPGADYFGKIWYVNPIQMVRPVPLYHPEFRKKKLWNTSLSSKLLLVWRQLITNHVATTNLPQLPSLLTATVLRRVGPSLPLFFKNVANKYLYNDNVILIPFLRCFKKNRNPSLSLPFLLPSWIQLE